MTLSDLIADTEAWETTGRPMEYGEWLILGVNLLRRWLDYARTAEPPADVDRLLLQLATMRGNLERADAINRRQLAEHAEALAKLTPQRPEGVPEGSQPVTCWIGPIQSDGWASLYLPDGEIAVGDMNDYWQAHGITVPPAPQPEPTPERVGPLGMTEAETRQAADQPHQMDRAGYNAWGTYNRVVDACREAVAEWDAPQPEPTLHVGGRAIWNDEGRSLEVELLHGPVKGSWSVLDDVGELDVANTDDLTPLPDEETP